MRKAQVQKPFIYYEPLKSWERVIFLIYTIVTICIAVSRFILSAEARQVVILGYAILTQLFLYLFLYVSLRNFRSYLIWFCFGITHFILYLYFKGDTELEMVRGNPSRLLINTIPLLLLFQLLRFFSIKTQKREFVVPAKGGGPDLIENKKLTITDWLLFVIYMGSLLGLGFLSQYY